MTEILPAETGLSKAASVLLNGGTVAFPTETFYGIAALPDKSDAISKIIQLKKRPESLSLPLLTARFSDFQTVTSDIPEKVRQIAKNGWPSAFSVVLPAKKDLDPRLVTNGTIAIRITSNPYAKALSALVKSPVISTSANISGEPPVTKASDVKLDVDLILDGGETPGGAPSSIVEFKNDETIIHRKGGFDLENLNVIPEIPDLWDKTDIPSADSWVFQPKKGYRFAIDSVLLASFVRNHTKKRNIRAMDLGAGSGVLSFILNESEKFNEIDALEVQSEYFQMLKTATDLQGVSDHINAVLGDVKQIKQIFAGDFYDLVVSNPPFFKADEGKKSNGKLKDGAMRGVETSLSDFVGAASRGLKQGGEFFLILPTVKLFELSELIKQFNFTVEILRFIHPYSDKKSNRVLLKLRKSINSTLCVIPPLIIYSASQKYTDEIFALINKKS